MCALHAVFTAAVLKMVNNLEFINRTVWITLLGKNSGGNGLQSGIAVCCWQVYNWLRLHGCLGLWTHEQGREAADWNGYWAIAIHNWTNWLLFPPGVGNQSSICCYATTPIISNHAGWGCWESEVQQNLESQQFLDRTSHVPLPLSRLQKWHPISSLTWDKFISENKANPL